MPRRDRDHVRVACSGLDGPRLPPYVYPEHYDLHVETDMLAFTFRGSVNIDIAVRSFPTPVEAQNGTD